MVPGDVVRQAGVGWADMLSQPDAWYATAAARAIADNVLKYQEPSGGWPKDIDMTLSPPAGRAGTVASATIDNRATYGQIRFLSRVHEAVADPRYAEAAGRGVDYLMAAQYANGGWPQFFPLRTDYSRRITFNDNAMIGVMTLLDDLAAGKRPFGWADAGRKARARDSVERGVAVILRMQVRVEGRLTSWCAQHDEVTLEPRGARAYEPASLSGDESVGIVRFLMGRAATADIVAAVTAAVAWFERVQMRGWRLERRGDPSLPGGYDRLLVRDPSAGPLWARFYEIGTDRPIFSGRDGVVRYALAEIEHERRVGYEWVGEWPRTLLERDYPRWRERIGAPRRSPGAESMRAVARPM